MTFHCKDLAVTNFDSFPTCSGISFYTISKEICNEGSARMVAEPDAQLSVLKDQLRQALAS